MSDQPSISEQGMKDFRMAYRVTMNEIHFLKQQQWRVTTFVFFLLAVLAACYRFVDSSQGTVTVLEIWALIMLAFLLSGMGCLLLYDFQKKIRYHWMRIRDAILPSLSGDYREMEAEQTENQGRYAYTLKYESMLAFVLGIILVMGASLVAWLLLKQTLAVAKGG